MIMIYEVSMSADDIKIIPSNVVEEIMQNVMMIVNTTKLTVPLDRAFGLDSSVVDSPQTSASRITAEIAKAISELEPRARFIGLSFNESDALNGQLKPKLKIEIKEEYL